MRPKSIVIRCKTCAIYSYIIMEANYFKTSTDFVVGNVINRARLMFVDSNPYIPAVDDETLRRRINWKANSSYTSSGVTSTTKIETQGRAFLFDHRFIAC